MSKKNDLKTNTEEKKESLYYKLLKVFISFFFLKKSKEVLREYSELYSKADFVCRKYAHTRRVEESRGKYVTIRTKDSPFYKTHLNLKSLIKFINLEILLIITLMIVILWKGNGLSYFKYVLNNFIEYLKISKDPIDDMSFDIFKLLIGTNVIEFKTFVIPEFVVSVFHMYFIYMVGVVIKNSSMVKNTKLFRDLALSSGVVTEARVKTCLWTPVGLFIDIEKGDAKGFAESKDIWTQLSMSPGKIDTSKESDHLIFVNSGFKLPNKLTYTYPGLVIENKLKEEQKKAQKAGDEARVKELQKKIDDNRKDEDKFYSKKITEISYQ